MSTIRVSKPDSGFNIERPIQKFREKLLMTSISLERDIYPAFSSGECDKICGALSLLIEAVGKSTHDADSVFRSFNWSWPMLTAKARSNSSEGIQIIEGFTKLLTCLLIQCSTVLIPSVTGCRNVIRIIMRDLGSMNPVIVKAFLDAIGQSVLDSKDVRTTRGFVLEKSAVEHLILLGSTTSDENLAVVVDSLVERILVNRKLFTADFVVDFAVKLIKSKGNGNSDSAVLIRKVLESHRSAILYDSLMDKLSFDFSQSPLKKLRVLHFLSVLTSSDCPGTAFPLTKAELTASIISGNKLICLFTLKLFGSVLNRVNLFSEKIVEISSLLPLLLSLSTGEGTPSNVLLLTELTTVILRYKKACPGVFVECKFNWLKLISGETAVSSQIFSLILKLLFGIYATAVPLTRHAGVLLVRAIELGEEREDMRLFCDGLVDSFFTLHFSMTISPIRDTKKCKAIVEKLFTLLIDYPNSLANLGPEESVLTRVCGKLDFDWKKIHKKISKKRPFADHCEEIVNVPKPLVSVAAYVLPRVSYKKRYLCPPFPAETEVDPLDPALAGWATICLANEFGEEEEVSVNLIDLVGKRVNTFYACIMSLSHPAPVVRQCAFEVLAVILRAVAMCIEKGQEEGRYAFREAPQVAMVLTWFRNGINNEECLPRIVTCFVVEVLKVQFRPENALYPDLFKMVLKKPFLRTNDFLYWPSFFYPTESATFAEHRLWILRIVANAGWTEILPRRGIVQGVMESMVNLNANEDEFEEGLRIMNNAVNGLESGLVEFTRKFAVIHWLRAVAGSKFL